MSYFDWSVVHPAAVQGVCVHESRIGHVSVYFTGEVQHMASGGGFLKSLRFSFGSPAARVIRDIKHHALNGLVPTHANLQWAVSMYKYPVTGRRYDPSVRIAVPRIEPEEVMTSKFRYVAVASLVPVKYTMLPFGTFYMP